MYNEEQVEAGVEKTKLLQNLINEEKKIWKETLPLDKQIFLNKLEDLMAESEKLGIPTLVFSWIDKNRGPIQYNFMYDDPRFKLNPSLEAYENYGKNAHALLSTAVSFASCIYKQLKFLIIDIKTGKPVVTYIDGEESKN